MTKRAVVCLLALVLLGVLAIAWDSAPRPAVAQEGRALVRRMSEDMARDIWTVLDTTLGTVCYVQAYSGAMDCLVLAVPKAAPKKTSLGRSAGL